MPVPLFAFDYALVNYIMYLSCFTLMNLYTQGHYSINGIHGAIFVYYLYADGSFYLGVCIVLQWLGQMGSANQLYSNLLLVSYNQALEQFSVQLRYLILVF